MKLKLTALLFLCTCAITNAQKSPGKAIKKLNVPELSEVSKTAWISLFNGENLDGWHAKITPEDQDKSYFKVNDGVIEANSVGDTIHDYMWLMSNDSYNNFALLLDFKLFNGYTGNTGVQFRSRYNDSISWLDGPQVDICVDPLWRTGMMWDETRNNLRWIYPDLPLNEWVNKSMAPENLSVKTSEKEQSWGEWNQILIIAKDTRVIVYVNGARVSDYNGDGVLNSENHQNFQVGMEGQFALQIHKHNEVKVAFKNIWVAKLNRTN